MITSVAAERVKNLSRQFAAEWARPDAPGHATPALVDTLSTAMLAFHAVARGVEERDVAGAPVAVPAPTKLALTDENWQDERTLAMFAGMVDRNALPPIEVLREVVRIGRAREAVAVPAAREGELLKRIVLAWDVHKDADGFDAFIAAINESRDLLGFKLSGPAAPPTPEIDCPLCGVTVLQIASATLSLALWQYVNWACKKSAASSASPATDREPR